MESFNISETSLLLIDSPKKNEKKKLDYLIESHPIKKENKIETKGDVRSRILTAGKCKKSFLF